MSFHAYFLSYFTSCRWSLDNFSTATLQCGRKSS